MIDNSNDVISNISQNEKNPEKRDQLEKIGNYIRFLANNSNHPFLTREDIIFTGLEAMLKAQKTFNEEKGANLVTYSRKVIYNDIASLYSRSKYRNLEKSNEEVFNSSEKGYDPSPEYDSKFLLRTLIDNLSKSESEVIDLLLKGNGIKEISILLNCEYKRVDNLMQSIKRKAKMI